MNNSKLDSLCPLPFYEGPDQTDLQFPEWDCNKEWAYGQVYPFIVPRGYSPTAQIYIGNVSVDSVRVYDANTLQPVVSIPNDRRVYSIEPINTLTDRMLVFYTSLDSSPVESLLNLPEGRYFFLVLSGGDVYWYSEIFTVVNGFPFSGSTTPQSRDLDMGNYIELQWRDESNFTTDDGVIVYNLANNYEREYWNRVFIMSDIGMPDYQFNEEGESRDGYFFPFKQISKKIYRFNFLASEYLCDSLRLVRMADHIRIRYKGQTYDVRGFNLSIEWQEGGWLASAEVEFETNTVSKKIGTGIYTNS